MVTLLVGLINSSVWSQCWQWDVILADPGPVWPSRNKCKRDFLTVCETMTVQQAMSQLKTNYHWYHQIYEDTQENSFRRKLPSSVKYTNISVNLNLWRNSIWSWQFSEVFSYQLYEQVFHRFHPFLFSYLHSNQATCFTKYNSEALRHC